MHALSVSEIEAVSGGIQASPTWYNIGHAVGTAYGGAISGASYFFCWVDGLDGSLAD